MKAKNKKMYGVIAMILAVIMVAALVPAFRTGASAYPSLSHIQEIKANQTMFSILEIVPADGTGSLGYYADGQEPTANWLNETKQGFTRGDRANCANGVFQALKDRGLMNKDPKDSDEEKEKYPLTYTGDYIEYYPWEEIPQDVETTELELPEVNGKPHTEKVYGDFNEDENGTFKLNGTPKYVGETGKYVQNIKNFVYGEYAGSDEVYYYKPQFDLAKTDTLEDVTALKGKALYAQETEGEKTWYKYEGTLGVDGFMLPADGSNHYTLKEEENTQYIPSEEYNADDNPYYAVADENAAFVPKSGTEKGYFDIQEVNYEYIGSGGTYTFTPVVKGTEHDVIYSYVYVDKKSGYTNNNWFQRYVFDVDKEDLASGIIVRVGTYVPGDINAEKGGPETLETLIQNYDMVVISAGFDYKTGNVPAAKYTADTDEATVDNDFTDEQANLIKKLLTESNKPVLLDSRLAAKDYTPNNQTKPKMQLLAESILGQKNTPIVTGSLYCFAPDDNLTTALDDDRIALATKNFNLDFDASLTAGDDKHYSEIRIGIEYENFLRENAGISRSDWLPNKISMATCIRYIINYSGQLAQNKKTAISVLDVEPRTQSVTNVDTKEGTTGLDKQTVKLWLGGDSCPITDKDISITTMSTAEFISKIDDINELYDLVYIGASLYGFNEDETTHAKPVYNDDTMNGLIYYNIGDKYNAASNLGGLKPAGTACRFSGNDITQPKATQLKNFVASGFPVVIADELISEAQEAAEGMKLYVNANAAVTKQDKNSNKITLTATPTVESGEVPSDLLYTWYKDKRIIDSSTGLKEGTNPTSSRTLTLSCNDNKTAGEYYCIVTYKGLQAESNHIKIKHDYIIPIKGEIHSDGKNVTYSADVSNIDLRDPSYQWYRLYKLGYSWYYNRVSTNTSFVGNVGESYIFEASSNRGFNDSPIVSAADGIISYTEATSGTTYYSQSSWNNQYYITGTSESWMAQNIGGGTPLTIQGHEASDEAIKTATVDVNSILYTTLSSEFSRKNVMSASAAKNNSALLLKYLNLSKPALNVYDKPASYKGDFSQSLVNNGMLQYTFTISNETDPTPANTRYTCGLYLDLNADGKFSDDEQISDLVIADKSTKTISDDALSAGVEYTLKRALPENYSGIIPWRLMVTQNGTEDRIHASEMDYTFIKPKEATKINILQITSKDGLTSNTFELGIDDYRGSGNEFKKCFDQLREKGIYDINIKYKTVTQINKMDPSEIKTLFDSVNMLVLGFGDTYGRDDGDYGWNENNPHGLNDASATAVTNFIATGKAVLFSHDTTSFCNNENSAEWGYYFNKDIRDSVGLDRYGAMKNSSVGSIYTEAYQPGQKGVTVNTTQGYTDLILLQRHGTNKYSSCGTGVSTISGNRTSTRVSRVNSGQITTYPYQIAETIPIAVTHEQYYQLNLNSDDVVVWYCLDNSPGSTDYSYFKHDGTNAYYIYNRGNVTYTGAGHTVGTNESISGDEAKLFVNTMVAAYRAAAVSPTVSFKTANNQSITTQILPVDIENNTVSATGNTRVYFTVSDTNLVSSKSVKIDFYYKNGSSALTTDESKTLTEKGTVPTGYTRISPTVYYSSGTQPSGSLRSDSLCYVDIPYTIAEEDLKSPAVTVLCVATTTIGKNDNVAKYWGGATLVLQKTGYLILQ